MIGKIEKEHLWEARRVRTGGGKGARALLSVTCLAWPAIRSRRVAPGIPQVFDATPEECPDNVRVFVEAVGLLMSNVLGASQSVK